MASHDSFTVMAERQQAAYLKRIDRAKKLFAGPLKEKFGNRFSAQLNPAIPSDQLLGLTQEDLTLGTLANITALMSDLENGGILSIGAGEEDRVVLLEDIKNTIKRIGGRVEWNNENPENSDVFISEHCGADIDLVPNAHHSGLIAQVNQAGTRYEFFVRFGGIHFRDGSVINAPNKFTQLTLQPIIAAGLPLALPDRNFYLKHHNLPIEDGRDWK